MRSNVVDITDQKFGYLTALYPTRKGKDKRLAWLAQCNWGKSNMTSIEFLAWIKSIYENRFTGEPRNENIRFT